MEEEKNLAAYCIKDITISINNIPQQKFIFQDGKLINVPIQYKDLSVDEKRLQRESLVKEYGEEYVWIREELSKTDNIKILSTLHLIRIKMIIILYFQKDIFYIFLQQFLLIHKI
jgi:hypothetical protein